VRRLTTVVSAGLLLTICWEVPAHADPPGGAGSGERPDARVTKTSRTLRGALRYTATKRVSAGVEFRAFQTTGIGGQVRGLLLDVDLRNRHAAVGLLHPPSIAERRTVSEMAGAQHAIGGVNGDFFNISETHEGLTPTGSSSGAEVSGGIALKGAVPEGQRFGPGLPPGTSVKDVIGVDTKRRGRVSRLTLKGAVRHGRESIPLRGLNQYAVPVGGIGAFTHSWGTVSRQRAVCGTDTVRTAPCSTEIAEVTVAKGRVTKVARQVGGGTIPKGTTVLVGREAGAADLLRLRKGDRVGISHYLTGSVKFRFAIGGFPILLDGRALAGLDPKGPAPRTAAGVSRTGTHLYLAVVDGRSETSGGLTVAELADLLKRAGADDAVNLDGGGSSTLAIREPGRPAATVRNVPSDGAERAVANGIGVFYRR